MNSYIDLESESYCELEIQINDLKNSYSSTDKNYREKVEKLIKNGPSQNFQSYFLIEDCYIILLKICLENQQNEQFIHFLNESLALFSISSLLLDSFFTKISENFQISEKFFREILGKNLEKIPEKKLTPKIRVFLSEILIENSKISPALKLLKDSENCETFLKSSAIRLAQKSPIEALKFLNRIRNFSDFSSENSFENSVKIVFLESVAELQCILFDLSEDETEDLNFVVNLLKLHDASKSEILYNGFGRAKISESMTLTMITRYFRVTKIDHKISNMISQMSPEDPMFPHLLWVHAMTPDIDHQQFLETYPDLPEQLILAYQTICYLVYPEEDNTTYCALFKKAFTAFKWLITTYSPSSLLTKIADAMILPYCTEYCKLYCFGRESVDLDEISRDLSVSRLYIDRIFNSLLKNRVISGKKELNNSIFTIYSINDLEN